MSLFATDVGIVGGGVAGAAAALTLRRYTQCRCVLLESSNYEAVRVGETVSPALTPLLDYLGLPPLTSLTGSIASFGSEATWGSNYIEKRASVFSSEGMGWNLDRQRFDASLAVCANEAGAKLFRKARLHSVEPEAGGVWRLQFDHNGTAHTLLARQIIDASGRRGAFARRVGARREVVDGLVGLTAYVSCAPNRATSQTTLVEAAPDGWWYATPLPGDRAVIAFMTDADLIRNKNVSVQTVFERKLHRTLHIRTRHEGAPLLSPVRVNPAQTQTLTPCIGPGWVAAGDAAASYDPLSSLGIGHALTSGIQAARIVHARLNNDEALARAYPLDIARNHAAYTKRRTAIYAAEQRWPEQIFWQRRHIQAAQLQAAQLNAMSS